MKSNYKNLAWLKLKDGSKVDYDSRTGRLGDTIDVGYTNLREPALRRMNAGKRKASP